MADMVIPDSPRANKAGHHTPKKGSGQHTPHSGSGSHTPTRGYNRPTCADCNKVGHNANECFSRIRRDYVTKFGEYPAPPMGWIRALVLQGFRMPVDWAKANRIPGGPPAKQGGTKLSLKSEPLHCDLLAGFAPNFAFRMQKSGAESAHPNEWCADSGASVHMCRDRTLFTTYQPFLPHRKIVGATSNMTAPVPGMGTIVLKFTTKEGTTNLLILRNVLFVPTLHENLLSIPKLDKNGFQISLSERTCTLTHLGLCYGRGTISRGTYLLYNPCTTSD